MPREHDPYDSVAYLSFPNPDTHPDRLAAMAILHGLNPAPVEQCRVLEMACGDGANIIPMAYSMPKSEFVGFDLARLPIERGQDRIRALGLENVRLFDADILDAGSDLGQFDYIIAHGFYAWVPEPVRDRLLTLCGELLAPDGVAFVSYNALPGGHLRKMIREMMLYHGKDIQDPIEQVSASAAFLRFVIETRPEGDPFRQIMHDQLDKIEKRLPQHTFHDELSEAYHPVLFSDFVDHAQRHGLQYLSEATMPPPTDPCYRVDIRAKLEETASNDIVKQEQALDFMRLRMFRETLLCRAERRLRRDSPAEHFRKLLFATRAASTPAKAEGAKAYMLPDEGRMELNHPGAIALIEALQSAWPRRLSLAEMAPALSDAGFSLDSAGVTLLMRLIVSRFVEIHAWNPPVARQISERPKASACGRQDALRQPLATTLLHGSLGLNDDFSRSFLLLVDGTRDRRELLEAMRVEFPSLSQKEIEFGIESGLMDLHRVGMLEA
jgi:SAM-dependent methyltransferase